MRRYTNFNQIDRDLKYLKLKSQIDKEELKLHFNLSKDKLKETMNPLSFVASTMGAIVQKALVLKIVNKILGITRVKKVDKAADE